MKRPSAISGTLRTAVSRAVYTVYHLVHVRSTRFPSKKDEAVPFAQEVTRPGVAIVMWVIRVASHRLHPATGAVAEK